jgi:hypothetical protein
MNWSVVGQILVASVPQFLILFGSVWVYKNTKRDQLDREWRDAKLNHYRVLISSLSDMAQGKLEGGEKFAFAVNTIALAGSQAVVERLLALHDEVLLPNPNKSKALVNDLLTRLMLEIRKDIGLSQPDDPKTFTFHMIGPMLLDAPGKPGG